MRQLMDMYLDANASKKISDFENQSLVQLIVKLGKELDAPIHLTWSCYQEGNEPCEACESCQIRSSGFEQARFQDLTQP